MKSSVDLLTTMSLEFRLMKERVGDYTGTGDPWYLEQGWRIDRNSPFVFTKHTVRPQWSVPIRQKQTLTATRISRIRRYRHQEVSEHRIRHLSSTLRVQHNEPEIYDGLDSIAFCYAIKRYQVIVKSPMNRTAWQLTYCCDRKRDPSCRTHCFFNDSVEHLRYSTSKSDCSCREHSV